MTPLPLTQAYRTLAFFQSAIKSGEPWSDLCEAEYRAAIATLDAARAANAEREGLDVDRLRHAIRNVERRNVRAVNTHGGDLDLVAREYAALAAEQTEGGTL